MWARSGRELFYLRPASDRVQLVAVGVQTTPTFHVVSRTPLFDANEFEDATPHANYDVAPDGSHFVMIRHAQASEMVLVQHWAAELPSGKE